MAPEIALLFGVIFMVSVAPLLPKMLEAAANLVENFPGVGGWLADKVRKMAQAISGALGRLFATAEKYIGTAFHWFARLVDHTYQAVRSHAGVILELANGSWLVAVAIHGIRALVHRLEHAGHAVGGAVKRLEREYHGIEHRVRTIERELAHGIGHDLRIHVKALEKALHDVTHKVIPGLRSDVAAVEGDVTALGRYVKDHYLSNTTEAITAAVAVGLAALGLGGLRCNSNPFKDNKNACGLFSDLSQLLGVLATVIAVTDFDELVREMQQAEQAVVTGLQDLLNL